MVGMRNFIYGVYDKTGTCGSYAGFFSEKEEAIKELKKQMDYAHLELGYMDLVYEDEKVFSGEKIVFLIHNYVLR